MINPQYANGLETITFNDHGNEMVLLRFYSCVIVKPKENYPAPAPWNTCPIAVATVVMTRENWKASAKYVRGFMAVQEEQKGPLGENPLGTGGEKK